MTAAPSRIDLFRAAAIVAAAQTGLAPDEAITRAGGYVQWLASPPATITVGPPVIAEQDGSGTPHLATRTDPSMPAVIKDSQKATYPAAQADDSKGFPVADQVTLETDQADDTVVSRTDNADGGTTFVGNAPGVVTLTWSDGTLTKVDTLQVTAGDAAEIMVGDPVIEDQ